MNGPGDASFTGLDVEAGEAFCYAIEGGRFAAIERLTDPHDPPEFVVASAFWDLQCNGRWGLSFSDPATTADDCRAIIRAQGELGTARVLPTLITASAGAMRDGVAAIARAVEGDPEVARMVAGIHLEGPSISEVDGYRGAHPIEHVRDPDWSEFEAIQEASGGRVVLVTIAPERRGAIEFIARAAASGVVVAIGHTRADGATISRAVDAGARLSTHLGNGIAATLARHPNPIWDQAADDRLHAGFIADGHHLGPSALRVLLRAKGAGRSILMSDASPLAGLPPGRHGDWEVLADGRVVVAGTPYLAGSARDLEHGVNEVLRVEPDLGLREVLAMTSIQPARLLGSAPIAREVGAPANLIRLSVDGRTVRRVDAWIDGRHVPRGEGLRTGNEGGRAR